VPKAKYLVFIIVDVIYTILLLKEKRIQSVYDEIENNKKKSMLK
jgi:hypothetical protein